MPSTWKEIHKDRLYDDYYVASIIQNMEHNDKILQRLLCFLPAHIKLQNIIITQQDCLSYLNFLKKPVEFLCLLVYQHYNSITYLLGISSANQTFSFP
jgi:hypothetical protein